MTPYRSVDDPAKLRRLLEAVMLLEADLSLPALLHHFVEEACSMVDARYGALGLLNEEKTELAEFITVGLDDETERAIGNRPTGRGVLGILITRPEALRLADICAHPESIGFPAGHPQMSSFLGVPVTARDEVYGNLYLTDKTGGSSFTPDDEALVQTLAQAAGMAIESSRLHQRVQEIAVLEDRDRIARDLHDAVIQRLFAVGLSLQGAARLPAPPQMAERVHQAIGEIDDTIRQIRSTIFELAATSDRQGVRAEILSIVHQLRHVVGLDVGVSFDGPVDSAISSEVAEHLLFTVREAVTNVGRHAQATKASVAVTVAGGTCTLRVTDNGRGMGPRPAASTSGGLGIANLRRRAEKLGGELTLDVPPGGGTVLIWQVPLAA